MKTIDIKSEKLSLIAWISQLQDAEIIKKLKSIQSDNIEIPEWQKEIVRERIRTTKPEEMIGWKEARKQFRFKRKS
jgi:hypothetical protein